MRHETIEKSLNLMMVLIVVAISIGGLVEIVPLMLSSDATEPAEGIEPLQSAATRRPRRLRSRRLLQLPFADDSAVPLGNGTLRSVHDRR